MSSKTVLSTRQRAFIAAIVSGLTHEEAAETLGVTTRTCTRYAGDPLVKAALSGAMDATFGQVTTRMASGTNQALDVLRGIMTEETVSASVRVRAAVAWLDAAPMWREAVDLVDRVTALEQQIKNDGGKRHEYRG